MWCSYLPDISMKVWISDYLFRGIVVQNLFLLINVGKTNAACNFDPPVVPGRGTCSTDSSMMSAVSLPVCQYTCLAEAVCLAFSHNSFSNRCLRHTCLTTMASNSNYAYYVKNCAPETTSTPETTTTTPETTTTTPETTTTTQETTTTTPETTTTTPETTTTTLETTTTCHESTTQELSTVQPSREISAMWTERMPDCVMDTDIVFFRSDVTLVGCTAMCTSNSSCVAVFYDFIARSCQGHLYAYSPNSPGLRVQAGSVHFVRNY